MSRLLGHRTGPVADPIRDKGVPQLLRRGRRRKPFVLRRTVPRLRALAATRRFRQDRRQARLGPGVRRRALHAAAHPAFWVWLSSGLQSVGHRDEAWLERGLPSS